MSRAFVKEDAEEPEPKYSLPDREDPGYDAASAWALIQGWNAGDPRSAEHATGYKWGDPKLVPHVEKILETALDREEERLESLARRYLRKAERRQEE